MDVPVALALRGHICPKGWNWAKPGLGSLCLFSFSLQLQLGRCAGCNGGAVWISLRCVFAGAVAAVAVPSLALHSCVLGTTWVLSSMP